MLSEVKILFENIKNFRHRLNEDAGGNAIADAIHNHEWLYIYYNGDENTSKGYRTIRPYVLGTHKKSGKPVLRAWQDNKKNSWHFENKPTRNDSLNHDYWTDEEGAKPGWRMFRVDKISKVYPIGKKFHDSNNHVMIPSGYHEGGDDDMSSIEAYVSTQKEPLNYKYGDRTIEKVPKKEVTQQKWDSIRRGNKINRKITANDILNLSNIASNVFKKNKGNYTVVIDDKNNFHIILNDDVRKQNIPEPAIVGSLPHLYDTIVKANAPANNTFFNTQKNQAQTQRKKQPEQQIKETELPSIPFEKKTFFKN